MKNFNLVNYLSKNKLQEAIELISLYPENPDEVAQKVADHFTETNDLDLIYSVKPGSLKMTSQGAYFDLDTKAGPNTPGEDFKDENGFGIENYLGDYAGGSFVIKSEEGLDEDFFVIRNMASRNAKIGSVTPEGEVIFSTQEDNLEETKSNKMTKAKLKEMIRQNILNELAEEITEDTDMQFGDPDVGLSKLYSDFYEGLEEAEESISEYKVGDILKFKDGEEWKVMKVKDNVGKLVIKPYNKKAKEGNVSLEIDIDLDYLKKNLKEAEEEVTDTEKVDVSVEEPAAAAPAEPTLTDAEKEIQSNLDKALQAAQELGNEKLIQQIGNTITFFTRDFVVKETYNRMSLEEEKVEEGVWSVLPDRIPEFINAVSELKDKYYNIVGSDDVYDGLDRAISAAEELLMNTAEVSEGKKEYYKDAEADDAEHIKALEKDMEDDKKSSMNESMFPLFKKIIK
jgi:hypothetical protein